jgi:hypothetical protein
VDQKWPASHRVSSSRADKDDATLIELLGLADDAKKSKHAIALERLTNAAKGLPATELETVIIQVEAIAGRNVRGKNRRKQKG